MLSVLRVKRHHLASVAVTPVSDLPEEDQSARAMTCNHQLAISHPDGDTLTWFLRLRVEFLHPEKGPKSQYLGHCEMVGEFELHKDVPEADRLKIVSVNGGAVLYSATREWFSILSSRSLNGMVELPTVDARCFMPNRQEAPAAPPP